MKINYRTTFRVAFAFGIAFFIVYNFAFAEVVETKGKPFQQIVGVLTEQATTLADHETRITDLETNGGGGMPDGLGLYGYERVSTSLVAVELDTNDVGTFFKTCPNSKKVLGGGYLFNETTFDDIKVLDSHPLDDSTWQVRLKNLGADTTAGTLKIDVFATCAADDGNSP